MESILSEHDGEGNHTPMDFDTLFDTKALRIMRILIPFFPAPYQPLLAVWVRFSQLQYALSLLKSGRFRAGITDISEGFRSSASTEQTITHLLHALKPCLSKAEYQELVRMQNLFSTYQRFQQLMPYLSALGGMSGDLSASDMMNVFSAMQGGGENTSASDIMSAFSAMQGGGENASASDIMSAFSAMQGGGENASASDIMNMFSAMQSGGETLSAADIPHSSTAARSETSNPAEKKNNESVKQNEPTPAPDSRDGDAETAETPVMSGSGSGMQDSGSGMNMSQILDLISLFQTSSNETDAENNTPERQDEANHE